MDRQQIFAEIEKEREYQNHKWGEDFDNKNTPNDWVAYMMKYLGRAVTTTPFERQAFHIAILKVVTLGVAILERAEYAPRHYDDLNRAGIKAAQ